MKTLVPMDATTAVDNIKNLSPEIPLSAGADSTFGTNDAHTQVINSDNNRIVVEAGPGTGKSYALRLRVQRLISTGIPPARIMAVTFTRTAANDLRRELAKIIHDDSKELCAGTLHAYCFTALATEHYFGLKGRIPRPVHSTLVAQI